MDILTSLGYQFQLGGALFQSDRGMSFRKALEEEAKAEVRCNRKVAGLPWIPVMWQ